MDATFWDDPRKLRPGISHLESRGHKLLGTSYGRIDCLATIEEETLFEDVRRDLDWMELDGTPVRVLSLPRLIEVKRSCLAPKTIWRCSTFRPPSKNEKSSQTPDSFGDLEPEASSKNETKA